MSESTTEDNNNNTNNKRKEREEDKKQSDVPHRGRWKGVKKHSSLFNTANKVRGILLACQQNREDRAVSEIITILNQFALEWYPITNQEGIKMKEEIEKRELKKQKVEGENNTKSESSGSSSTQLKYPKRFRVYDSGGKGYVFLEVVESAPFHLEIEEFVKKVLKHPLLPSLRNKCKNCHRLIPVQLVVKAEMQDIKEAMNTLIAERLPSTASDPKKKFAILFKTRNNKSVNKDICISEIADMIGKNYEVDLKNPDYFVVVEVFKSACALSILTEYSTFAKFNIQLQANAQEPAFEKTK